MTSDRLPGTPKGRVTPAPGREAPVKSPATVPAGGTPGVLAGLQQRAGNHAVQGVLAPRATEPAAPSHLSDGCTMVQRHASWEHKMLGDVDPATLEVMASGRDAAAGKKPTVAANGRPISVMTVLHALDQEISRVQYFQNSAPTGARAADKAKLADLDASSRKEAITGKSPRETAALFQQIDDTQWDIRLVSVPLSDDTTAVVTYGEMNTMADFYGSPEEMKLTPPGNFRSIVAGIREESLRKLMRLRNQIGDAGVHKYDPDSDDHRFAGSIGNTGKSSIIGGDTKGELRLMGKGTATGKAKVPGQEETSYTAGLGRNACHFAPQSWHAWAEYHEKAMTRALASKIKRDAGDVDGADADANEALLLNGFGDHFLEDSFAAGHLINKTLIMQWFVKWVDAHPLKSQQTRDKNWRKSQAMAYAQPGLAGRGLYSAPVGPTRASDPQTAENTPGTLADRFAAAGLALPGWMSLPASPEFLLFTWWQSLAARGGPVVADIKDMKKHSPIKEEALLKRVLTRLHADGVIHYESYDGSDMVKGVAKIGTHNLLGVAKNFELRAEWIPKDLEKFQRTRREGVRGITANYERMAKTVSKGDYSSFLNNSYVQIATNVLHDDFCKKGLTVSSLGGDDSFKIYGDNAMLQAGSAKGVVWSGQTARMSRDAVYHAIEHGAVPAGRTTADIDARLPKRVTPERGAAMSLEEWHGEGGALWTYCNETSFPETAAFFAKGTVAGLPNLAPVMSKDDVHPGEGF